ncbi:hypothetical protein AGIG_G20400 [Arapaima gigas]
MDKTRCVRGTEPDDQDRRFATRASQLLGTPLSQLPPPLPLLLLWPTRPRKQEQTAVAHFFLHAAQAGVPGLMEITAAEEERSRCGAGADKSWSRVANVRVPAPAGGRRRTSVLLLGHRGWWRWGFRLEESALEIRAKLLIQVPPGDREGAPRRRLRFEVGVQRRVGEAGLVDVRRLRSALLSAQMCKQFSSKVPTSPCRPSRVC